MSKLVYFVYSGKNAPYYIPAYLKDDGTYTDETWPDHTVLMTEEETQTYWKQSSPAGYQLGVSDKRPAWVKVPPPSKEQLIELAEQKKRQLRLDADSEIAWRQDAVDAGIATDEEKSQLLKWKTYRVLLMRVDTSKAPDIEWPKRPN